MAKVMQAHLPKIFASNFLLTVKLHSYLLQIPLGMLSASENIFRTLKWCTSLARSTKRRHFDLKFGDFAMSSCKPHWSIPRETSHVKIGDGADSPYEDLSNQSQIETKSRVNQTQGIGGYPPLTVGDWAQVECNLGSSFTVSIKRSARTVHGTLSFWLVSSAWKKSWHRSWPTRRWTNRWINMNQWPMKRWTNWWINMKQWVWRVPYVRKSSLEL